MKIKADLKKPGHTGSNTESDTSELQKGERLSDLAYREILRGLFTKKIAAGAFLSQNYLSELFGLPIQPLRDALRILEAEGVLTVQPRSGIRFLKPNLEFAQNTFQFRAAIERPAARRYAESGPIHQIQKLVADHQALLNEVEQNRLGTHELETLDQLEQGLHGGMIAHMNNPLIEVTARRLSNYVKLILIDRTLTPPIVLQTLREHLKILDACANRNPDDAEAALSNHFRGALQRHLGMF
jgi:DNA-binding GntR family transcriptional regulator